MNFLYNPYAIKTANRLIHCELFWLMIIFVIHRRATEFNHNSSNVKHQCIIAASKLYLSISLYSYFLDYKKLQNYYIHLRFLYICDIHQYVDFFFNI